MTGCQHLRHRRRVQRGAAARRAAPADRHRRAGGGCARPSTRCSSPTARARVLKGETPGAAARIGVAAGRRARAAQERRDNGAARGGGRRSTDAGQARFAALKAWRAEVAREHNLPAYVIFHDATLAAIAALAPRTLDDLQGISGHRREEAGSVWGGGAAGGELNVIPGLIRDPCAMDCGSARDDRPATAGSRCCAPRAPRA